MSNGIILRKNKKAKIDYFSVILCIFTILLLVIQVAANKHFIKANKKFIEAAQAKRVALKVKERKALMEKELEEIRLKQQQEEEEIRASMEGKITKQEGNRLEKVGQKGMDYQHKLAIYQNAKSQRRK
ncbi:MAG: hypothetical protein K6E94_02500 [Elusimicrobiaceae bacterium]|nr:hypothetical protein [Elusimicrobiaceae bacterium]